MAFTMPYQDPLTQALAMDAYWDILNVELDLLSKHAVITLAVWYDQMAHDGGYQPLATFPPRVLRPDEFDAVVELQPLPTQITLAAATRGFAEQLLLALPEFQGAQIVP